MQRSAATVQPLHIAAERASKEIVALLLKHKEIVNGKYNNAPVTVLSSAVLLSSSLSAWD